MSAKEDAQNTIDNEAKRALLNEFLNKEGIKLKPALVFPNYNKLPVELELAIAVMKKHEPDFELTLVLEKPVTAPQEQKPVA